VLGHRLAIEEGMLLSSSSLSAQARLRLLLMDRDFNGNGERSRVMLMRRWRKKRRVPAAFYVVCHEGERFA